MKIYISGKITGLPREDAISRFSDAESFLQMLNFTVINPINNGLNGAESWLKHMVRDIELLEQCDAIFMLSNWQESRGAKIEYDLAVGAGLPIMFEDTIENNETIERLIHTIHEVTGLCFKKVTATKKTRNSFYARMIFAYHCREMKYTDIGAILKRTRTTINYYINRYEEEYEYNRYFRRMASAVERRLSKYA